MANDPAIQLIIASRERDLGGFSVRRILPYATHRMVGPFIFFDHMGPADFAPSTGMDVRPHPHINLATVTYLFEGRIHHRDSLGSDQLIEPGAVNWMISGRGIVHSERTPPADRANGTRMNGIQCWVALPEEHEEMEPRFNHHPKEALPEFQVESVPLKLLLGCAFGRKSPVEVHSDLFYLEARPSAGSRFTLPVEGREAAIYVVEGSVQIGSTRVDPYTMVIGAPGQDLQLEALSSARVMLLGGKPLGPRFIYWNFVSSSMERINQAKQAWLSGPSSVNLRFNKIPGDDLEFIPLPNEPTNPKGTIM